MKDWIEKDEEFLINTYSRMPLIIDKANGHYLEDANGNKYLDLFCGVGVNSLGHRHPHIMEAIQKQSAHFLHISNNFANPKAIHYAELLVKKTFGKGKVFFGNSGTEASESAIKLVHKWTKHLNEENRGILVIKESYHGRTLGALQFTRQENVYQDFPKIDMPFYEIEANNIKQLEETVSRYKPHAIMIETVLGAGGIFPLSNEFLNSVQNLCDLHDILLVVDEVQTGYGRTGTFFSYEQTQLQPDIIIFAKACGGGLPLSGVIANERTSQLFHSGDHGTTFGPNPLSIAAGIAMFELLRDTDAIENGRLMSELLFVELKKVQDECNFIKDVRHKGMMFGISLDLNPNQVKGIQNQLIKKGILVDVTKKTVIRLLPPLTLTSIEIFHFIDMLKMVLKQVKNQEISI